MLFVYTIFTFNNFQDCTINRRVHTRALEGGGEKPSRHDHEGPPFICCFIRFVFLILCLVYDGRKPKALIAEIVKF